VHLKCINCKNHENIFLEELAVTIKIKLLLTNTVQVVFAVDELTAHLSCIVLSCQLMVTSLQAVLVTCGLILIPFLSLAFAGVSR